MNRHLKWSLLGITLFCSLSFLIHSNSFSLAIERSQNELFAQNFSTINRFQTLAEGDRLYRLGEIEQAEVLYRQAKPNFSDTPTTTKKYVPPVYEVTEIRERGQKLWQKARDGLEKNLKSKVFFNLQTLIKFYPEFIPGHIALSEFCLEEAEYCETTAKDKYPSNPREIMEQLTGIYPDEPDILRRKIDFLLHAGEKDYDNYLEASISARQFALFFVDYPEAPEFNQLADEYLDKYQGRLKTDLISSTVACGILGAVTETLDRCAIIGLMLQGESKFGATISEQYVDQFKKQNRLVNNGDVNKYIEGIAGRMTPYLGRDFDYEFYVVKDDAFNAFALPGGKIFINTGAIEKTKSEAELAGLIGHELSHAAFSHGYRRMAQSSLTGVVGSVIPFGSLMYEVVGKEYSRTNERQADVVGTRVLSASGYAADGLRNMMLTLGGIEGEEALESLNNADRKSQTSWRATHPAPIDRVRYLEQLIVDHGYNRYAYEGVSSHQQIQQSLRSS